MSGTNAGTLRVPGAILYHTVRGAGPLLLVIQSGDADAEGCDGMVEHLVEHYTVVTYDRRGLSRSALDEPPVVMCLDTHSEDVHYLLAELTPEPVLVFGTSMGALIGLDLAARHPGQVHTLVAHEPPAPHLLHGAEAVDAERAQEEVEEVYAREGAAAAMKKFSAMTGGNFEDREPDVVRPAPTGRRGANLEFFLAHDAAAVRRYRLDVAALAAARPRIVPAAGHTSRQTWPHHCAVALAHRLGTRTVEFPGGHSGSVSHPRAFAARLHEILGRLPGPLRSRRPEDFDPVWPDTR
jgi:pimeloyl-ACP methyl ester carboxylesterase